MNDAEQQAQEAAVTEEDAQRALDEMERLINDPDVPLDASRVWMLAGRLSAAPASPDR